MFLIEPCTLMPTLPLWRKYHYPYFVDEAMETQRGMVSSQGHLSSK